MNLLEAIAAVRTGHGPVVIEGPVELPPGIYEPTLRFEAYPGGAWVAGFEVTGANVRLAAKKIRILLVPEEKVPLLPPRALATLALR